MAAETAESEPKLAQSQLRQISCPDKFNSLDRKLNWSARSSRVSEADLKVFSEKSGAVPEQEIKATWKRYIILLLFCLNSGNKSFQWIQIVALTSAANEYYQVSNYVINMTSVVFLLSFIVLSCPACLLIESIGLRRAVLMASFGTAVGSVIKVFSCEQGEATSLGITLLLTGQVLVSLAEQLVFSTPSRLASVWFPDSEVSTAVAMSYFGSHLGVSLGFIIPTYMMRTAETREQIGAVFYQLFFWTVVYSATVLLACYLLFDEEPKFAPGKARWRQRQIERSADCPKDDGLLRLTQQLLKNIGSLLRNVDLLLLSLSYALTLGINVTFLTLLDQMLSPVWPDKEELVGQCGFLFVICGALGMIFWGWLMDQTHAYKWINIWLTVGTILSTILFAYELTYRQSIVGVYITGTLIGVFSSGIMATGLEYAVELTYPAPELVTSSVMNVMPQMAATPAIFIGSYIVDNFGALQCNIFYLGLLLVGLLFMAATRERLLRQQEISKQAEQEKQQSV